jgi:hypothetical protein
MMISIGGITLHRNGKPLTAGEIPEGAEIIFDRTTGEVTAIRDPRSAKNQKPAARRRDENSGPE